MEDTLTEFEKSRLKSALLSLDAGEHLNAEELKENSLGTPWSEDGELTLAQKHLSKCRHCRALVLEMQAQPTPRAAFGGSIPLPDISGISRKSAASLRPDDRRDGTGVPQANPQSVSANLSPKAAFSAPPPIKMTAASQPVSPAGPAPTVSSPASVPQFQKPSTPSGTQSFIRGWGLRIAAAAAAILAVWVYGTHRPGNMNSHAGEQGIAITPNGLYGGPGLANEGMTAGLALDQAVVETNGDVRMTWKAEAGANTYVVTVRDANQTGTIVSTQDTVTPSAFLAHTLLMSGRSYQWSVTAKGVDGKTLSSGAGIFTAR